MNESLHSTGPSLASAPRSRDKLAKNRLYTSTFDDGRSIFEETTRNLYDWKILHRDLNSHGLHCGNVNDIDEANMPNISFDTTEITEYDSLPSGYIPRPTLQTADAHIYTSDLAFSVEESSIASMLPSQAPASRHSSAPPQTPNQHYGPFLGRFSNSAHAKLYRRNKMRFGRMPWRDPENDPTIAETENNRDVHVERIYNAMISGEFARDNANSTALKRWVYGAHYQSDLVEAYAHKVFDCLLEQVKKGFRGWHQNDYVNDERKGDDDDKDIDCAGRLDNIVTALQQEKSICENVMSSAWQIRMFVNAPKAYAKRKDQNRVGNSKRPNTKSSETTEFEPRPLKMPRNTAATRRKPVGDGSKILQSRPPVSATLQQHHTRPLQPVGNIPSTTKATTKMVPVSSSLSPREDSFVQQANAVLLSPTSSSPALHTASQYNLQPSISLPPLPRRRALPPPEPRNNFFEASAFSMTPPTTIATNFLGWSGDAHFDFSPSTPSQLEPIANAVYEDPQQDAQSFAPCDTVDDSNVFDCHDKRDISLSNVELFPLNGMNEGLQEDLFEGLWNLQETDVLQVPETTHQPSIIDPAFL